jgi:twitching motility protein PilT
MDATPALASTPANTTPPAVSTPSILAAMLQVSPNVSDLIFSPGKPSQVELSGKLMGIRIGSLGVLTAADTHRIAMDLIGDNQKAQNLLKTQGDCDLSYSLSGKTRFRVNIFKQRGTYAIVMRVIPAETPTFGRLKLPEQIKEIITLKNGIVLVTGPSGSGKSSTLAAIIDLINETHSYHIVTLEDPIEFLHKHKKATVHQRELHSDTPTFSTALRSALRQAPKVILVGEMRDRETIEIAMEAAETGHLVLSTMHTIDASKTVERIVGGFPTAEQPLVRSRLANTFRWVISQRLVPRADGTGRTAVIEILRNNQRTHDYVEKGERDGRSLLDAIRDGGNEGMQHFDGQLEKLAREGVITADTAIAYSTNAGNLRLSMTDLFNEAAAAAAAESLTADSASPDQAAAPPASPVSSPSEGVMRFQ